MSIALLQKFILSRLKMYILMLRKIRSIKIVYIHINRLLNVFIEIA